MKDTDGKIIGVSRYSEHQQIRQFYANVKHGQKCQVEQVVRGEVKSTDE